MRRNSFKRALNIIMISFCDCRSRKQILKNDKEETDELFT